MICMNFSVQPPLTNLQAELLGLFAKQLPEEQLLELKQVIAKFLLEKARDRADSIWDKKGYDESTIKSLLDE
jgi:hypothetical protein